MAAAPSVPAVLITCRDSGFANIVFTVLEGDSDRTLPWSAEFFEWKEADGGSLVAMVVPTSFLGEVSETVRTLSRRLEVLWNRDEDSVPPEALTRLFEATVPDRTYAVAYSIEEGQASSAFEGYGF